MPSRTLETKQALMLRNAPSYTNKVASASLIAFSIRKVVEMKLASTNFRTGLDFNPANCSQRVHSEVKRFYKLIRAYIYRSIPFLENNTYGFITVQGYRGAEISMRLIGDKSTFKYLSRFIGIFNTMNIPIRLSGISSRDSQSGEIILSITFMHTGETIKTYNLYKLLMLLPDIITIYKTLSRKAVFTDERFKDLNRYVGVNRGIIQ